MTSTRHLHISLAAAPLTLATPAFALNAQPLPPGTRFDPGLVNHAQVVGVWNRGPLVLRCHSVQIGDPGASAGARLSVTAGRR